jgi:hypothetical protein
MDLAAQFPIIPHESAGVECEGCIITETFETAGGERKTTMRCNECDLVVGTVNTGIVEDLVRLTVSHGRVKDVETSPAQLRGALILAARRIIHLSFGRRDDKVLPVLRRILREARRIARPANLS